LQCIKWDIAELIDLVTAIARNCDVDINGKCDLATGTKYYTTIAGKCDVHGK
jgi:hypothetical protein